MGESVYIETTFISYLAARQSRDLVRSAHQQITREWWERRSAYELYISELVLAEIAEGDPKAAAERTAFVGSLHVLGATDEANELAEALVQALAIPPKAARDAVHVGERNQLSADLELPSLGKPASARKN